ncbi:probable glycosyltransferase At5g03795 isoform X2 [Salvia hispanica]|uniref:probable glycosyltransferase At5g03795 isoform X1 n=1 Tax=Salvia hispanica TaxID=49212 RepID=UPI0020099001|nr:probable glycosyltransferase At5g03795 isoform X1 [Salvia hispanica]XP_047983517.1 probable glycosyltransferase At5g03795 isoform X2 [Salvia hispanica]
MAASAASFLRSPPPSSLQGLFLLLITTSVFFFLYSFSSIKLDNIHHQEGLIHPPKAILPLQQPHQAVHNHPFISQELVNQQVNAVLPEKEVIAASKTPLPKEKRDHESVGSRNDDKVYDAFHDRALFTEEYARMKKRMKIYTYPHSKNEAFANVLLPEDSEPGGNYASESYFKKALFESHFLTNDPSDADLFYLPFSIASLRHDKRVGVGGIKTYVKNYVRDISQTYPFWNRTGGADHFYIACHSVGRTAMEKAVQVKLNAIQVVCSSSYFLPGYVSHKDASIPQIWPRKGPRPTRPPSLRRNLAFYAGAMNSRVRESLVKTWGNDSEISVHRARLKTPYSESLLRSKFCIHAKGFEVNTARIGDALYYGCVPVVLADHYDLPYADILNWESFSVVLSASDIPIMKRVLLEMIRSGEYLRLQENVVRVQKHFQWHSMPVDYDAFYMVMYELWLRRSHVSINT